MNTFILIRSNSICHKQCHKGFNVVVSAGLWATALGYFCNKSRVRSLKKLRELIILTFILYWPVQVNSKQHIKARIDVHDIITPRKRANTFKVSNLSHALYQLSFSYWLGAYQATTKHYKTSISYFTIYPPYYTYMISYTWYSASSITLRIQR